QPEAAIWAGRAGIIGTQSIPRGHSEVKQAVFETTWLVGIRAPSVLTVVNDVSAAHVGVSVRPFQVHRGRKLEFGSGRGPVFLPHRVCSHPVFEAQVPPIT